MTKRRPNKVNVNRLLDELYTELPELECKGMCQECCGPIDMSEAERERIAQRGVRIDPMRTRPGTMDCPALTALGACSVYEVRPMICRLWGSTRSMPCPHGCRPKPNYLSETAALDLLCRSLILGGGDMNPSTAKLIAEMSEDPEAGPLIHRLMRGDKTVRERVAQLAHQRALREHHEAD